MDRTVAQLGLFASLEGFPEGFSYEENILSLEDELTLVRAFASLPLKAFEFQGFQGKRTDCTTISIPVVSVLLKQFPNS